MKRFANGPGYHCNGCWIGAGSGQLWTVEKASEVGSTGERAARTHRLDLYRSPFAGVLEAGWTAFAVLVAIRQFDAPEPVKALIAGASPLGFLLAPLFIYAAAKLGLRPGRAGALMLTATGLLCFATALAPTLFLFATALILAEIFAAQQNTLMAQIYSANYRAHERGRRVAMPFVLMAVAGIAFSVVSGRLLDWQIEAYTLLFSLMGLAAFAAALAFDKFPGPVMVSAEIGNPWQNIRLVAEDKLFALLLGGWMLLGLGNLMTLPLRVEYLADPRYGINADNTTIAILLLGIPALCRVLSTRMWGRLFDRLNLMATRNLLNVCFAIATSFFFFENIVLLAISMAFLGFAMGGGKIIWSLWVTRLAPPGKVAGYMSIHMAFTGIRGVLAPFLGYWLLTASSPQVAAIAAAVLIMTSSLLFHGIRNHPRLSSESEINEAIPS